MHSSLKKWLPAELEQVENKSAPAKVRPQTTAKLARKDLTRCARQASM